MNFSNEKNKTSINFTRRSNREKVVGKRKGKNRAREERMFFSWGAQPGFLWKRGTVERVTDFFQKKSEQA